MMLNLSFDPSCTELPNVLCFLKIKQSNVLAIKCEEKGRRKGGEMKGNLTL